MNEFMERLHNERVHVIEITSLIGDDPQVAATLLVASANLLVAEALERQNALAERVMASQHPISDEHDGIEWDDDYIGWED